MGASRARPGAAAARARRPSAAKPEATGPEATGPEVTGPGATRPEAARLEAAGPPQVVEFAAEQLLSGQSDALPAVLGRLAEELGGQAALAVQFTASRRLIVLAAHPAGAASDPALLATIGVLCSERARGEGGRPRQRLGSVGRSGPGVLLAWPPPDRGEQSAGSSLCTLALVGEASAWTPATGATLRVIAAFVAAQIRHAGDAAGLAERVAVSSGLISGSPDPIVATNSDRRVVEFNPAAEVLLGWHRADVLGRLATDTYIPERDKAQYEQATEAFLRHGDRGQYVGRLRVPVRRADGSERMVELTPVPLTIDGEVHFCGFLRDLTDLEQAQAALAESDARFGLLCRVAPVGIVQTDAEGRCTFANDRWHALTGTPAGASPGDWTAALHPDDVERVAREWARAAASGAELRTDCRLRPAAGGELWVHVAAMPLPGPGGDPAGYLAAVMNITERKRAEAERERLLAAEQRANTRLADQTERLNSLIAVAIPGVLFADETGVVTQVNQSFCDLFGLTRDPAAVTGTPVADLVWEVKAVFADPPEFIRRTSEALAARRPASGEQMTCADGRTLECDYWPVLVGGDYRGDLWLAWDMSERTALEQERERLLTAEQAAREMSELAQQQLAEQNTRLRDIAEAKTQFLATVSHELRTPLSSIISFTELIRLDEPEPSPDTAGSLDVIERNARRLLRVVGDLLLLSRIEAGDTPLDLAAVRVPEIITDVASSAAPGAAERGIRLEVEAGDGPPVQADQARLQQVFDNLLSNAIKFTATSRGAGGSGESGGGRAEGGTVRIGATYDGQAWRVEVTDSGIGIPPAELDRIFDRFTRGSNARAAGLPGTGLGLSVVKAITELHGGRVEAESAVGRGTTFRVYLPAPS